MHLAVLVTNTDESPFAQRHPKDAVKFARLIASVRPDWKVTSYSVKDDVFPDDITAFDGIMITGSPASVHDDVAWMPRLFDQIRVAHAAGLPLFGACFGHQAIALALGGEVVRKPVGWCFGLVDMEVVARPPWFEGPDRFAQYAAHVEEVSRLPEGAQAIFRTPNCATAGFVIGNQIYTTQNHPEMTPDFIAALVEELAEDMGPEITNRARGSLKRTADTEMFAETIARFFETATGAALAD